MKGEVIGCFSSDDENHVNRLTGDAQAFETLVKRKFASGECTVLEKGMAVTIEDYSWGGGTFCVRPKGETDCLWTPMKAVEVIKDR